MDGGTSNLSILEGSAHPEHETSVTTPADLIGRARTMAAALVERTEEIDQASRLPDDVVAGLVDNGFVKTLVPRIYGGYEFGLETTSAITQIFAATCPSIAWVLAFYMCHNWQNCQFGQRAQEEVFASGPSAMQAGSFAPAFKLTPVAGGFRASGRNAWYSGSPHATWILSAGIVDGTSSPLTFLLPASEARLVDTWKVAGMRATGSWDAVLDDVFIPEHRTMSVMGLFSGDTPGSKVHGNPFYTKPLFAFAFGCTLPVVVGATRGVIDEVIRVTQFRVGTMDHKAAASKPMMQMRVGRGLSRVMLAEGMLRDLIASIMAPDAKERLDADERWALRARGITLVQFCRDTVNDLVFGAGANAFRQHSRLQMLFRDVNMLSTHFFFDEETTFGGYGRVALGLDAGSPT